VFLPYFRFDVRHFFASIDHDKLKEKLTEVLENRSERNRWISQFTQFSTLETLDRRALIHMVQSIRVRGKKELDITFTHEDEYKKALQLLALAAQQKDYEQRKVG